MLLLFTTVCSVIALTLLVVRPGWGILAIFLVRPLVDTTWDAPVLFGLKLTEIVSALVPLIMLPHMLMARDPATSLRSMPLRVIWILWALDIVLFSGVILYSLSPLDGLNILFRHLNGFVGFYMLQAFYTKERPLKAFLITLLVTGLFPIGMGVFEGLTGHHWKLTTGEDGVIRNIGLYHDAITIRYYALQTIMGVLLFSALYLSRRFIRRALIAAYGLAAAFVVYGAYSKSGTTTLASWLFLWPVLRKKMKAAALVLIAGCVAFAYYGQAIYDRFGFIFRKELSALEGTGDVEHTFAGRWYVWEDLAREWVGLSALHKLIGSGQIATGMHNDYLQILYHGGILGLSIYLCLLLVVGTRVVRNLLISRDALNVGALLALIMWMVDTIGLVPSAYPGYQWFVWGIIGLALRRHEESVHAATLPEQESIKPRSIVRERQYAEGWARSSSLQ